MPASLDEVAQAYARKNNWKITPSGDLELNQLGLSTQVPNIYQYVSSGPKRKVTLDNGRVIEFRHVEPRESTLTSNSAVVIEALKAIGKNEVTPTTLQIIYERIGAEQYEQLKKEAVRARSWIRDAIFSLEGESK